MRRELQQVLAARLFKHLDDGSTDRSEREMLTRETNYTDPARAARERDEIVRKQPVVVGTSSQLVGPGAFLTADVTGIKILVVRQDDGSVRAFRNVCRHRCATVIAAEVGKQRVFNCPYHGWAYSLDGRLRSMPDGEHSFPNIDRIQFGLIEFAVAEWHGLIWVVPTEGAHFSAEEYFGMALGEELAAIGLDAFHLYRTETFEQPANWKLVMEGFLETYHVRFLHPNTVAKIAVSNLLTVDTIGEHLRLVSARKDIEKLRSMPAEEMNLLRGVILTYALMPSTIIVFVRDHFEIWSVTPHETDATKCQIVLRFLTPQVPGTDKERDYWDRNWTIVVEAVHHEDWAMAASAQTNLGKSSSGLTVFGCNELALHHFHRHVNRVIDMGSAGKYELSAALVESS
jgi:nitrite reductase/ring-hydroxylating ferredoxin subunit